MTTAFYKNRAPVAILLITMVLLCPSCFVDHDVIIPLPERKPGDPEIFSMPVSIYYNQAYFSLDSGDVVAYNDKLIWDLGFECNLEGWHVVLNAATRMRAANLGHVDFNSVDGLTGSEIWDWDESDGNLDSTAIGQWMDPSTNPPSYFNNVYIIDRGYSQEGNTLGYKKVQFLGLQDGVYEVRFANLDGSDDHTVSVEKDPDINFVALSFDNVGSVMSLEPRKDQWDLLFAQYTGYTPDDDGILYPYYVQGVLLNPNGVEALVDTSHQFQEILYDDIIGFGFSSKQDTIGHLWKDVEVDIETLESVYTVDTTINHIIKGVSGHFYKLRFLNFYNELGEKGYTVFEYQRL